MWCLGDNASAFGYLLSIPSVDIFACYVSIYVVLFCFWGFFPLLYLWCCCVYWFLWVLCDFDGWMFLWLIILCLLLMLLVSLFFYVAYVADLYFITLYLKKFILFWCHFFTFNQDYLTVFYMKFVLVIVIYLVWYVFGCFIFISSKCFSLNFVFYSLWHNIVSYILYIFTH